MKYPDDFIGKILNADCLDIMQAMPDNSVDMILTDPPYGINYLSHRTDNHDKIINDGFSEWQNLLPIWLAEFKRILTPTGVCCCCGGGGKTPVSAIFTMEAIKHFNLIQTLIWRKFIGLGWKYRPAYETIIVLSKSKDNYNFFDTSNACGNVIEGINQTIPQAGEHPTKKPVELMEKLIKIHAQKEHLIFEPFCGGGSTLVAAERLGNKWIGVELDKTYCEIAQRIMDAERAQLKLF